MRNAHGFEGSKVSLLYLKLLFLHSLYDWMAASNCLSFSNFVGVE